ncbi:MAG: HipA domain-containing protein [Candidatus Sericytochromatia bacterium]|nr:HipA domain-containing protein [Candidatus Sericytochromatia bacterium]
MNKCLYCYKQLKENETDFHKLCSRKIFGTNIAPLLPYNEEQMLELADRVIKSQVTVTGVQPKLSLNLEKISVNDRPQRFTIVGLWGEYILKPPTKKYPDLPENEDLTMHLATLSGIKTVPHSLIRLESGKLSYITKRIDRLNGKKIHMEDMCQLTEKLTEQKYLGSYEQIAKVIIKFSANPLLDTIDFFEQLIFCFLTGNADMHLKNFSLIKHNKNEYILSPAYDLVSSALVVKEDDEDLALTLNGKKKKIKQKEFIKSMELFKLEQKVIANIFSKFNKSIPKWLAFIEMSFLPEKTKEIYKELIIERANRLEIN